MNKKLITIYIVYSILLMLFSSSFLSVIFIPVLLFNIMFILNIKVFFEEKMRSMLYIYIFIYGLIFDLYLFKPLGETSFLFLLPLLILYFYPSLRLRSIVYISSSFIFNILLLIYILGPNFIGKIYNNYILILFIIVILAIESTIIKVFIKRKKISKNIYTIDI
jgi:hypothetical protein